MIGCKKDSVVSIVYTFYFANKIIECPKRIQFYSLFTTCYFLEYSKHEQAAIKPLGGQSLGLFLVFVYIDLISCYNFKERGFFLVLFCFNRSPQTCSYVKSSSQTLYIRKHFDKGNDYYSFVGTFVKVVKLKSNIDDANSYIQLPQ